MFISVCMNLFQALVIFGMVEIGTDTTLRSSQPTLPRTTVKATETQCRTETNFSGLTGNERKATMAAAEN